MLPFQKTGLYQNLLQTMEEVMNVFEENSQPTLKKQVEEESFTAISTLAKAFSQKENPQAKKQLQQTAQNISAIMALMDLAAKKGKITSQQHEPLQKRLENLERNTLNFFKNQKKILILSVAIGQGHMSAAKAITQAIEYQYGYDYHVEIIDFLEFINKFMNTVTKKSYENIVKFAPGTYKFLYESSHKYSSFTKMMNQMNYPFLIAKVKKLLDEKNPDIVVSTSPFWSHVATEVWKKYWKESKFISIVTDSTTIHRFWVNDKTDFYVVANEDSKHSLKELGVEKEKILTLGFPVKTAFLNLKPRRNFLQDQGLDPKKFTILFLPTAQNQSKNEKIGQQLLEVKDANIIIIAGRDHKTKPKLEKLAQAKNTKVYGWTDEMPEFIKAADLVLTKAGGATTMECIAAGKPMIITSVIPGQEEGNAQLIRDHKLGTILEKTSNPNVTKHISSIRKNYKTFQKNIFKIRKPDASLKIAEFITELIKHKP